MIHHLNTVLIYILNLNKMNILVTGANGQLGNEMRIVAQGSPDNYIFTDVNEVEGVATTFLDITDIDAVRSAVALHNVDVIVNCAAYTNVDAAETNEAISEKLNATAPENLAIAIKEANGLLVQISTDYVFGQEPYNTPCKEDRKGTPAGVYGLTKLHGEEKIMATGCKHAIIRTAWLYSEFGKNFCKTILNLTSPASVEARIVAGKPAGLKVVFDQVGTPTYALDLAKAIAVIIEDYKKEAAEETYSKTGIYHYSNEGVCSWYDFTRMIAQIAGQTECDVQPCHSNEFPSPVTRPSYSVLDKTKIKSTFGIHIPYWVDSLKVCIESLKNQ